MTLSLESQLIQALSALVYIAAIAGITYVTPKIKRFLEVHIDVKNVPAVESTVDEISKLAENVVNDFNNRLVNDAKSKQAWNPQFAQIIKSDAISSLKTQMEPLLSTLIEQAVTKAKDVNK
jgi:hypothetical protein